MFASCSRTDVTFTDDLDLRGATYYSKRKLGATLLAKQMKLISATARTLHLV
jgi:hypothetical protein